MSQIIKIQTFYNCLPLAFNNLNMRRDLDSSDIFEEDQLTIDSAWGRDSSTAESEAPFKIGLNFLREDDYPSGSSMGLDHSNSDWKNDSRDFSLGMEENLNEFTQDQIYKINNVNQKLRILVLYENVNPELRKGVFSEIISSSKNKGLKKSPKDKDMQFITQILDKHGAIMEKALEPVKMGRLASIPQSKRKFYVKKSDMEDIQRKKALKALTIQKVRQFGFKKGLSAVSASIKKKFEDKCQTIEQILTQTAIQIQEDRVVDNINQTMLNERKQTQKDLKASVEKYYTDMERIHLESFKLINQQLAYRDMVLNSRNIKRIDFKKKTRNSSDDLNTILGIGNFFNMIPNLGYQVQQEVDRSQLGIDASFSKEF